MADISTEVSMLHAGPRPENPEVPAVQQCKTQTLPW